MFRFLKKLSNMVHRQNAVVWLGDIVSFYL